MRVRIPALVFVLLLVCGQAQAQDSRQNGDPQQSGASTQPPSLTTLLKKTVGFLHVGFLRDGTPMEARGTCFFVFYEDNRVGENGGFVYLVTNRHMAEPGVEEGKTYPVTSVTLRMNLKTSDMGSLEAPISSVGQPHWFFPVDTSVDLAITPLAPDQGTFDYLPFPVSLFATRDIVQAQGIAEGDSILFTGYFYQFPGQKKFQPIVREGVLAMMPDEPLDTTLKKAGHLYLGDLHVFGGNSGSPLFVNLGGIRHGELRFGGEYRLLGIVSGFYHEDSNLNLTIATTLSAKLEQNSGIAMVVPVDELKLLLDSAQVQAARDQEVARRKSAK
jgi:hypothetical protein